MMGGTPVRADRGRGLIRVPGGPSTLILILAIFIVKYTFGVWLGMAPSVAQAPWFVIVDCGVSGLIAGMFVGRFGRLVRAYLAAPDEDLSAAGV